MKKRKTESRSKDQTSPFRHYWGLASGTTMLNHGSFGACPLPILKLQSELRAQMEAEPVQFLWRRYEERLEPSRAELARFVGARPKDLVFVTNATTGVNCVLRSFELKPGDEVLTTDLDYNACRNALACAVSDAGARLIVANIPFPSNGGEQIASAVLGKATRRTKLAMIDHVTSGTALVLPLEQIVSELEARGVPTLVDGAHAPGMVPLNLSKLNPSYYTANLHKWVCAPKGAAFLWVREDKQARMQPAVISHGNNTPRLGYTSFQDRFDWAGTFDPTAWFCVGTAIKWMEGLVPGGWPEIRRRNHDLAVDARRLLCENLGIAAPCPEQLIGSMATLPLPENYQGIDKTSKIDPEQIQMYDQFRIEVPMFRLGIPERRYFRISAQVYNTLEDYQRLSNALVKLQRAN